MTTSTTNPFDAQAASSPLQGSVFYLAKVCLVASIGGLLFGFDTAVISGTVEPVKAQYGLTDLLQGWFASSALVGCILGAAVAGVLGDRFGRKPILMVTAVLFFVSALFCAVAPTFSVLILARIVGGLGVGMASVLAPMYISEFAPPHLRGRLVAQYQLSIVLGILVAYFSNWCLAEYAATHPLAFGGEGALHRILVAEVWRSMFGAGMLPAGLFVALLLFTPESPRWLAQKGRMDQAFNIFARVAGRDTAKRQIDEIATSRTDEPGTVADLFKPGLRTALLVGVMLAVFGQLSGVNIVVYYGPKILVAAGYRDAAELMGQVGLGVINLIFTIIAMLFIDRWGRRPLLIGGMTIVAVTLAVIGGLFFAGNADAAVADGDVAAGTISKTLGLWIAAMMCVYMACISLSICAVIWVLTPEIFPNSIRGRAASIATLVNWSTNALSAFVFPWVVATFGMYSGFLGSAAICFVAAVFFWRFVPETAGRSLEEIESYWLTHAGKGVNRV